MIVKRTLMMLLLLAELAAAAGLAIALRHGRFDHGATFYLYIAGPLVILAAATAVVLPLDALRRVGVHGLLLLGCVAFALPFVWLVGTSFKYEEEVFVFPPKWLPAMPAPVVRSPYVAKDAFDPIERPAAVNAARWQTLEPALEEALWQHGVRLNNETVEGVSDADVRQAMVRGLWQQAAGGVADNVWSRDDAAIVNVITNRVDLEMVRAVRDEFLRRVELGAATITDDDGIEHRVQGTWARDGDGAPVPVSYDLTQTPRIELSATFDLPIDARRLLALRLPMRQDRSWNQLTVQLEAAGRRYELEDALFLGQKRWQELTFRLKHKDDRDERDTGVWPLIPAEQHVDVTQDAHAIRLTLGIERASPPAAAWRKYTSNYRQAYLASGQRWTYVRNSFYLVALTVLGQVLSCSMVAYAFARIRWPGREVLFVLLLGTMMLPAQVTMIPTFLIFKHLGLYNTLRALWLPSFFGSAFFVFMLRQFMKSIPTELEEAARIDGCGYFGIYWRIILPLMKPALAAVAIFTFMSTWNDFLGPLIYVNDQRLYPLSLGLFDFRTQHGAEYGMLMAASTLMTLPVIVVFFAAQRYFIEGITLTGMKA